MAPVSTSSNERKIPTGAIRTSLQITTIIDGHFHSGPNLGFGHSFRVATQTLHGHEAVERLCGIEAFVL